MPRRIVPDTSTKRTVTESGFRTESTDPSRPDRSTASGSNIPWGGEQSGRFGDIFFPPREIQGEKWNRLYPYRLLVVDVSEGNKIFGGGITTNKRAAGTDEAVGGTLGNPVTSISTNTTTTIKGETGLEYVLSQEVLDGQWIANLPITPQQLTITDQFAINTSATMRGIIEEHNGVKFKNIMASGTTGIWPRKPTKSGSISTPSSFETIFAGTIEAFSGIADSVTRIANSFSGNHPNSNENAVLPLNSEAGEFSTGYYQAMYLAQFVERYAMLKKNPDFKNLRLVFDIPKQNKSYVVTPITYSIDQSEQRPNEIKFKFQFKAWKSIDVGQKTQPLGGELPKLDTNLFQKIIGIISETRTILSRSVNLIKAVRSDFQKPFNILRQTGFAVKDTIGVVAAVGDLPRQIVADFKDAVDDAVVAAGFDPQFASPGRKFALSGLASSQTQSIVNPVTSGALPGDISSAIRQRSANNEGLSGSLVTDGALGIEVVQAKAIDPLDNVYQNPEENFEFFDAITIDDLKLTPEQEEVVEDELDRIRLLTIDDFRDFRADMLNLALNISNNFGSGDQVYSDIYDLPDPNERSIPLTIEENEIIASIFEVIQVFDLLISTKQWDDLDTESPLEFVGGLANEAGIDFDAEAPSKLLVPIPFGLSIEEIAARYLTDPDKWVEIATINKLRSPYIDEVGFVLTFLSNAEGRQFNVDDSESQLFIGQKITLRSNTVPQFVRKIISVEKISDGNFLVTVDGLANLDNLTTLDGAGMQGFLPGTVNSQNQIYIPSSRPAQSDDRIFPISHLDEPNLTKVSKVDFLLTDNFDIALNSLGDFRLSNGLTNLIQALKLKVKTQKGTLLRHLDFGLGLTHGISVADIESGDLITALNTMVQEDPRFSSISRVSFRLSGSTLAVDMVINVANSSGIVPITFDVRVV